MAYSSGIQLINDANGTTYAFLSDNAAIWQCQWNAQAQRWEQGQEVPQAFGGTDPQVLYLTDLWPNGQSSSSGEGSSSNAGIVLAYRMGQGSSAEIYASFGAWGGDGQLIWSAPVALTNDGAEDQQFALVPAENGEFRLVVQKQEAAKTIQQQREQVDLLTVAQGGGDPAAFEQKLQQLAIGSRPDSDLYQSSFQLTRNVDSAGAVSIALEALSGGTSGEPSGVVAPVVAALQSSAAVQAAPQLAFAPPAELQRSQVLAQRAGSTTDALGASDANGQANGSGQNGDSGESSSGWNAGQYRWKTPGGSLTAGAGLFPTRYMVTLSQNEPAEGGELESDNRDGYERSFIESESDTESESDIEAEIDDIVVEFQDPGARSKSVPANFLGSSSSLATGILDKYGRRSNGGGGLDILFTGLFGGVNEGSSASAVINTGKFEFLAPKAGTPGRQAFFGKNGTIGGQVIGKSNSNDGIFNSSYSAIAGGAGTRSIFSYSRGLNNLSSLQSYTSGESLGVGYLYHKARAFDNGGTSVLTLGFNAGLLAEQFHSGAADPLPEWLSITGRSIEAESIALNALGLGRGLTAGRKGTQMMATANALTVSTEHNAKGNRFKQALAVFNGFVIPAATDILLKTTESSNPTRGYGAFVAPFASYEYLTKYRVGVKGVLADELNYYFAGTDAGSLKNITYASAGAAIAFGTYIPLLTYFYKNSWQVGGSSDSSTTSASDPGSTAAATTDSQASPQNESYGLYSNAATGSAYPFLYNPDSPSSARVTSLSTSPIEALMLGAAPSELYRFTLSPSGAEAVTIRSSGSGLTPTTEPVEVDILGPSLDPKANSRAKALVSINAKGQLHSVSISAGGSYLYLPESGNNTGEYILPLDLASAGLISSEGLVPVVSVVATTNAASNNDKPLLLSPIERIAAQLYSVTSASAAGSNQSYPLLAADGSSEPVNPSNNNLYSYNNVPLLLYKPNTTEVIQLLNNQPTARVVFSNNEVVGIQPLEELIFLSSDVSATGYTLVADLAAYGQGIGNPDIANLDPISLTIPRAESEAYNNVVSESQFSTQTGANNSGVYIADGLTDTLPLFPEYGNRPISSRVVWYSYDSSNQESTRWFLNASNKEGTGISVEPNYINQYSEADLPSFSVASSPTAVTISGTGDSFSGDTLVAWVEATKPVIPIGSNADGETNGEENFQSFMDAIYGDQRINYRINQSSSIESSGWAPMDQGDLDDLYKPDGAVITELRSFNVSNPFTSNPDDQITLLTWTEIPLPGSSDPAAIKVAMINPNALSYSWSDLTTDNFGNSTISSIPWDGSRAAALAINNISIAALTTTGSDGSLIETPVLSFDRDVRTPYRQSVLNDNPDLFLQFGALTPGISSINIGSSAGDTTTTYASATGLDFSIASAIPKSQSTAVANSNGTGVLISALGTNNAAIADLLNQVSPADLPASNRGSIASFSGSITSDDLKPDQALLSVTELSSGSLAVGATLTGSGVLPGTTITEVISAYVPATADAAATVGTYRVSQAQTVASTQFKAYPNPTAYAYTSLELVIDGTTLSVYGSLEGELNTGDRIGGLGIVPGTTITAINRDSSGAVVSYAVNQEQSVGSADAPLTAIAAPGGSSSPYTIEFWTQTTPDANPNGAGLVAYGQPSTTAVGKAELPDGWLLESSFIVDRITYQQAAARGDTAASEAIGNGTNGGDLYAWGWVVLANGANTTAMGGNGGSNLYSNALELNNLRAGATLSGVSAFLAANGLSPSDLPGLGGSPADVISSVPQTQLQFAHFINEGLATSNLNTIAIDTTSANLNQGVLIASDASTDPTTAESINTLFESLWEFQQKTGEAKVTFSLAENPSAPESSSSTPLSIDQFAGYALDFTLSSGAAVSINGDDELVFDVAPGVSLLGPSLVRFQLLSDLADTYGQSNSALVEKLWQTPRADLASIADLIAQVDTNAPDAAALLEDLKIAETAIAAEHQATPPWFYVAASYLPDYRDFSADDGTLLQVPANSGTASIYINNQLVAQSTASAPVIDAFTTENVNDQLLILANNNKGAIDQLAVYGTALSAETLPAIPSSWDVPSSEQALLLLRDAGLLIDRKTPDPGATAGAVTAHWDARDVNPNDAELSTFYSIFSPPVDPTGDWRWSTPTTFNPELAVVPTIASATSTALSVQDNWLLSLPTSAWADQTWSVSTSSSSAAEQKAGFNPSGLSLENISVNLSTGSNSISLTPEQVLLGNTTLADLQPLSTANNLNYTLLSNAPSISLLIDPNDADLNDSASITFSFSNGTTAVSAAQRFNPAGGDLGNLQANPADPTQNGNGISPITGGVETSNKALATAAVIEQAPLQLKYIDSGEVFRSQASAATANQISASTPAQSFGTSQTAGSFASDSSGTYSGWLAIAQPRSNDAVSDPGGRIYIQYTGDFTTSSGNASGTRTAVADSATAPITWLNALAGSNFSPDHPNLPLLNSTTNQSSTGGLLILADATVGWGDNFGQVMVSADVNDDGVEDLVISAPQANGGGRVYIINGTWIQSNLTTDNGATTLNLANPDDLGDYVVVLTPGTTNSTTDDAGLAGFGSALAFDDDSKTLWIGAPNYLRQLDRDNPDLLAGVQPIGALFSYSTSSDSSAWSSAEPQVLTPVNTGQGGSTTTIGSDGSPTTSYWGSMLGSAIAVTGSQLAVSAPGFSAGLLYSGTKAAQETYLEGKRNPSSPYGNGALIGLQLPDVEQGIDLTSGDKSKFADITTGAKPTDAQDTHLQNLKDLQTDNIVGATIYNNQAVQAEAIGAVYLSQTSSPSSPQKVFYGPNPWNVLGASGFGSSLAFIDLNNSNSPQLAIGADATGGSGAVYVIDPVEPALPNLASTSALPANQYLAHAVASLTLYGAESQDLFGNGVVNLGDVNQDGYDDLLIQAMNAASAAGAAYVLFGSDQFDQTKGNPATGSVGSGSIGIFSTANGSQFSSAILQELGYGSGFSGSGSYGSGDINADGINDIQLGSGPNGSAYLTWGHPYLEAVDNLALNKLASNTGYMLDGLATTTAGSLRSIGDFNGDGYGDFISIQPGEFVNTVRIELGANTQEILADYLYNHYTFTVSTDTQVLPAGDINGDGLADIAMLLDDGGDSTTGVLYGRSSDQLPIGSGFGFLAPVDPATNAPLASLPNQQISGGLSSASPAVLVVGDTLYAAVQGVGEGDTSIWLSSSSDGGNNWTNWSNLSQVNGGFATTTAPALAFFEQKLYMSFLNPEGDLQIASLDPGGPSLTSWSTPATIASGNEGSAVFTSKYTPQLIDEGDALAVIWVAADGTLYSSISTTPDQATEGVGYAPTSSWSDLPSGSSVAAPALAQLGNTVYMAVQGNGDSSIYWNSSSNGGTSWGNWQALPSSMTSSKPPSLAVFNDTLYLSYLGDGNNEINITSLTDAASNTWSDQYVIPYSGGNQSALYASLVAETVGVSQQLALYYISNDESQSLLLRTATDNPSASSSWSQDSDLEYNNGLGDQTASGPLAVISQNGKTLIAYQGGTVKSPGNEIYLATSAQPDQSSTWSAQAYINPNQRTSVGLTTSNGLPVLSYTSSSQPDELQLNVLTNSSGNWQSTANTSIALGSITAEDVSLLHVATSNASGVLFAGVNSDKNNAISTSFEATLRTNDTWLAPKQLLERSDLNGTVSFLPIKATAAPAATMLGADPVIAVNENGTINLYSPSPSGSSLILASSFSANGSDPAINSDVAPGLTATNTGLALTYTNTDQSISLERLDFFSLDGEAKDGVILSVDGFDASAADLLWQRTTLNSTNSDLSTSVASAPVVVDGNLLLTSIDADSAAVQITAIPNSSDPISTTWLNSTIQLPDSNGQSSISFGDLNGDGYNDYFDPESSIWIASAPEAPVFSLWSIRAAGDVNGNGVDDVLLALTPQGPSYQAQSDGKPAAIYSALIDGALFNVTNNSFNLSDLKAALNPYNSTELFDVTTMSYSDEYQSLQSWFSPILKYQAPIEIDSVSTLVEGDSAYTQFATNATYNNSPAPTLVHDASGNLYSITTQVFAGGDNTGIRLSNTLLLGVGQDSLDPNAINVTPIDLTQASPLTVGGETFPSDSIAPLTPGAAIHDGKLYVAIPSARSSSGYGSSTNDIWIAYADLDNAGKPLDEPSSWTTYQVQSNGGVTDENSLLTPTLVSEGERLALYFPSGSEGNNDVNLNIRYLYSNDPTQQAGWGSSLSSTTNTYTGTSSTISIDASLSQTPSKGGWASESGVIVTSPIAATTYQGRTVLAFRGYADGGGDNVENGGLLLAFAPTARGAQANSTSSSSADWTLWDSGTTGINTPSIATDQANLYLTYTPWSTSATNAFFFPVALNIDHLSPNKQVDLSASNLVTAGERLSCLSRCSRLAMTIPK